ncbi:hypothetical protein [Nocardia uniformis]|nr:hypothetical protein [Nocardia uniformis]
MGTLMGAVLGGQGLIVYLSERRIRAAHAELLVAQSEQSSADATSEITNTVLALLDQLRQELKEERQQRIWLWRYVKELRADMAAAGIPLRPIPEGLREVA